MESYNVYIFVDSFLKIIVQHKVFEFHTWYWEYSQ